MIGVRRALLSLIFLPLLLSFISSSLLYANGQQVHAQTQQEEPLLSITMKVKLIEDPINFVNSMLYIECGESLAYSIYDVIKDTTNLEKYTMNKFNKNISSIEYDFTNSYVCLNESNHIILRLIYTTVDATSTADTIKTTSNEMWTGTVETQAYEKQVNTSTNTTTYNEKINVYIDDTYLFDADVTLEISSNNTGILTVMGETEENEL